MKIAVLGAGLMGAPMALRLAAAGHDVTVWNRSLEKAAALGSAVRAVETPAEAASGAAFILSILLDGSVTASVLDEAGVIAAADAGALIVNMASVEPAMDRRLAAIAAARGVGYIDAPVSGGVKGAEDGSLAILVGGARADFERARPVLESLGRPTLLGPVSSGQVAKLANQLIVGATIGAVAEGLRLAEAAGCDPAAVRSALSGGFAESRILQEHGARMVAGDFTPGGRSSVQLKDLRNVMALAEELGTPLPLSETALAAYQDLVETHDGGELDHSAYFHWLALRRAAAGGADAP